MNYFTPKELFSNSFALWKTKADMPARSILILAILAGAYVAFGAEGSTMASHDIPIIGLSRFIAGIIFATGLLLIIVGGGELFTGNALIWLGVLNRQISIKKMLRNWFWVYLGNFIGAVIMAYLMYLSGLWKYNHSLHGISVLKIAISKVNLTFTEAFVRGILCNWIVCLAVWVTFAAKDITGKILALFFPILLFVVSNFEHSVANMYYLTAGLLAKTPAFISAGNLGAAADTLTLKTVIMNNLIPVTLGNIIGGTLFVACFYFFAYPENQKNLHSN